MLNKQLETTTLLSEEAIVRTRAALDAEIERERKGVAGYRWISGALLILIFADLFLPITGPVVNFLRLFLLLVLSLAIGICFLFGRFGADNIRSLTARKARLDQEESDLGEALEFVEQSEKFALVLRSFEAEAGGISQTDLEQATLLESKRQVLQSQMQDSAFNFPDLSHFDARARWEAELGLLACIHQKLPVILLGNYEIGEEMIAELRALGVREVLLQATPWWPVFERLAAASKVIVFFIQHATPMLLREMSHVLEQEYPYFVVGLKEEISRLPQLLDESDRFLETALAVISCAPATSSHNPIDQAAIEKALERFGY